MHSGLIHNSRHFVIGESDEGDEEKQDTDYKIKAKINGPITLDNSAKVVCELK